MDKRVGVSIHIKDEELQYILTEAMPRKGEEVWLNNDHYVVTGVVHRWNTGVARGSGSFSPIATESYNSEVHVRKLLH